jgi:hypothetical protein
MKKPPNKLNARRPRMRNARPIWAQVTRERQRSHDWQEEEWRNNHCEGGKHNQKKHRQDEHYGHRIVPYSFSGVVLASFDS